ncbi:protein containing Diacylglycerol kinase, catalytic region domain protein, partial [gut metagenome]
NEVVNGLMKTDFSHITLGFIPTGSGNDFARGLGMTTDISSSIARILNPTELATVDIGLAKTPDFSRYFIVSSGIGYDAEICAQVAVTPMKKILNKLKIGKLTYVLVAIKQLISFRPCSVSIRLDHKKTYCFPKFFFLAAMNMKYEGGGAKFCPDAQYDDGVLDLCLVGKVKKLKILFLFPSAFLVNMQCFEGFI